MLCACGSLDALDKALCWSEVDEAWSGRCDAEGEVDFECVANPCNESPSKFSSIVAS